MPTNGGCHLSLSSVQAETGASQVQILPARPKFILPKKAILEHYPSINRILLFPVSRFWVKLRIWALPLLVLTGLMLKIIDGVHFDAFSAVIATGVIYRKTLVV
jgi:hypothetical protein